MKLNTTKNIYGQIKNKLPFQGEYLIYPKLYWGCHDFYNSVIIKRKRNFCKHLLAQVICEALNNFQIRKLEDRKFRDFLSDLKLEA